MTIVEGIGSARQLEAYDEMRSLADERTLEILERRRRTAVVRRRGWLVRRVLLAADVIGLVAAFFLAELIAAAHENRGVFDAATEIAVFLASVPAWIVIAKLYRLYDRDEESTDHSTVDEVVGVFHMITVCTWAFWAGTYISGLAHPTPPKLLLFWVGAIAFVSVGRACARGLARRHVAYLQNTVIVGAGDVGQLIARKLLQHPEYGINLVGFVDDNPRPRSESLRHLAVIGEPARITTIVQLFDVERVILAFSNGTHKAHLDLIRRLKDLDVQIDIVPRLFELVGPNVGFHTVEGLPLLGVPPMRLSASSRLVKRLLDLSVALATLALSAPVLIVIALIVKLDSPGPIFYRHRRTGLHGKPIDVVKFRTMRIEACRGEGYGGRGAEEEFARLMTDPGRAAEFATTYKLEHDPRVTRAGRVLRKLSLDELPQLVNVVRGDLSLVGPRPITEDELPRYGDDADTLLNIRPGVTGYWQINGRSRLSYEDRVRLDLSYIAGWSLRLDLEILGKTMRTLLRRQDAR